MRRKLSVFFRVLYANIVLIACRLWYFKRQDVGFGYINKGIEIYRCELGSLGHKFRISHRLKFIKGVDQWN